MIEKVPAAAAVCVRTLNGCTFKPLCLKANIRPTDSDVLPTPECVPAITITFTMAVAAYCGDGFGLLWQPFRLQVLVLL